MIAFRYSTASMLLELESTAAVSASVSNPTTFCLAAAYDIPLDVYFDISLYNISSLSHKICATLRSPSISPLSLPNAILSALI